jgi:hypothetical protein
MINHTTYVSYAQPVKAAEMHVQHQGTNVKAQYYKTV